MPGIIGALTGFIERQKGKGFVESSALQRMGKSGASMAGGGCISAQLSNAGIGNGADTTADTLFSVSLPANVFDIVGRSLQFFAWGSVTASSATKTVAFAFGSSITTSVAYTTTQTGAWALDVNLWKTGASAQGGFALMDTIGATTTRNVTVFTAGTETDTAAIVAKITGQSSVGTAGYVLCNGFVVYGYN
jgi:hypothetical protein